MTPSSINGTVSNLSGYASSGYATNFQVLFGSGKTHVYFPPESFYRDLEAELKRAFNGLEATLTKDAGDRFYIKTKKAVFKIHAGMDQVVTVQQRKSNSGTSLTILEIGIKDRKVKFWPGVVKLNEFPLKEIHDAIIKATLPPSVNYILELENE